MDERQLIAKLCDCMSDLNKSFSKADARNNGAYYAALRNLRTELQECGCEVNIAETWADGLVCCEVTINKVRY